MERREREEGEAEGGGEKKGREDDKGKREDERAPFSFEPGLDLEPPVKNKTLTLLHLRTDKPFKTDKPFITPTNRLTTYKQTYHSLHLQTTSLHKQTYKPIKHLENNTGKES